MAKRKRYHQSVADRMAESRGMERYETKKKMRKADDMMEMYSNDHAAMPQDVRMHYYAKEDYVDRGEYADSYAEKNRQEDMMVRQLKKQLYRD